MSSTLKIRNIDFQFPDDTPWNWNPGNPGWGNAGLFFCFVAPGFERYFIKAIRQAIPRIKNPAVAEEADLFCKQEGQHARHHQAHIAMLTQRYPELKQVMTDIMHSYDELYENESLEFHLAYAAVVEATFSPLTNFVIENRHHLFKETDTRMASFLMWHLMEEYEHRSSALNIYNDVVGSYWYRLRKAPQVIRHLMSGIELIETRCNACIPAHDVGVPMNHRDQRFLREIPLMSKIKMLLELSCTLFPYHNPDHVTQPEWGKRWFADEAAGKDMTIYYS
ncbi:MAG: metal-dependent hydrolase [Cellvibrionales bacterium]|jgi:predicted metal-dependent hydrolase|nr:metal-dependent hydrolase [Cellvibrionales bacterium]